MKDYNNKPNRCSGVLSRVMNLLPRGQEAIIPRNPDERPSFVINVDEQPFDVPHSGYV